MSLSSKINEFLTREVAPERRGVWRWVSRITPAGLTGLKIALAAALLANAATDGALGDLTAQFDTILAARFGKGLSPENTAIALAAVVLLQDGGKRAMSILQKTLEVAMKPLLNERYHKGQEDGLEQGWEQGLEQGERRRQQEWEAWLERQRQAGISGGDPDDPPPSDSNGSEA